jgi:hypothetical protein
VPADDPVNDQPDAQRLLEAMAEALTGDVMSGLDSEAASYTVRIVANLCRILAREAELGPAAREAAETDLRLLLGGAEPFTDLVVELDRTLADDPGSLEPRDVFALLVADVDRRLAIARPDYRVR